ncbi:MAG: hypothetical protein BIFFINMI_02601 [Phycisphaerae bacterium]|nr:hypothetical protein [Phycisphaerae bacterium]
MKLKLVHIAFWLTCGIVLGTGLTALLPADDRPSDSAKVAAQPPRSDDGLPDLTATDRSLRLAQARLGRPFRDRDATTQPDEEGTGDRRPRFTRGDFMENHRPAPLTLTDAQTAEIMQYLRENDPRLVQVLEETRKRDAAEYDRLWARVARSALYMMELKRTDPELHGMIRQDMKLGLEIQKLAQDAVASNDPVKQSELREQMRTKLEARFDLNQKRWNKQIQQFQKRIDEMQRMVEVRQGKKEEIIERQIEEQLQRAKERMSHQGDSVAPTTVPSE